MDGDHKGRGGGGERARILHYPLAVHTGRAAVAPSDSLAQPPAPPPAADEQMDLANVVGRNLRRLRTQRGYSLGRLAEASGVSRAMLGQIELGRSVPSIGVLWKIARALDVRFSAFTDNGHDGRVTVLKAGTAKVLMSPDGSFTSRALFPADARGRVEFYQLRLSAGGVEEAHAHPNGTTENLVVTNGSVEIDVEDKRFRLEIGDSILFEADVPHAYRNPGASDAIMFLVMIYSDLPAGK